MARRIQKKKGISRLKSMLPKKRALVMRMPEERDEDIHWLFWVLVILVIVFLVSLLFLNWQGSSALLSYLSY